MTPKSTILLVNDGPANQIALEALLSNDERELVAAHSGKEALEIIARQKVDLILLDVHMPDMDGFELAQILKSTKETAGIAILFASAERLDHAWRMKGFEEGAIDYLFKPLDPEITKAKVKVLLSLQRQKEELIEKNALLERSALLINNSADIIGVLDARGLTIEEMNPAFTELLGYVPAEYHGKSLISFMDGPYQAQVAELARSNKEAHSFETRVTCKDGTARWLDLNAVVKHGKWLINVRDRTEIRQLNNSLQKNIMQLEAANKELESFSYSVSHDLRAPLRALNGNARIMEEDFGDQLDDAATKCLRKIQNNASRMDELINDLLSFSRLGRKELRKARVDMNALVRHTFDEVSQLQPHKARIEIGDLPEAYGDYAMLQQVWVNLISNAIKYSSKKEHPLIVVGSRRDGPGVSYFIQDNGAGFDMAYAGKLFGTFQRLHDVTEFEGSGIGLAIVQRIIHRHGGTIDAKAAPEQGATFWFSV